MGKINLSALKKEPKKNIFKSAENQTDIEKGETKKGDVDKKRGKLLGRPKKSASEKLSKKITVNFTEAEYSKLKKISTVRFNMAMPKLVRMLLQEKKII